MKWKDLKIGTKLTIGFGSLLVLLIVVSLLTLFGFAEIKKANQELTQKKDSALFLVEKEIDHLGFVGKIKDLFLDQEVTTLTVKTDHTKCSLGQWLYSRETEKMMQKDKHLAGLITRVKIPHEKLHQSAAKIKVNYVAFDITLDSMLAERWIDHLVWIENLSSSLLTRTPFKGGVDAHQCAFGKWYYAHKASDPDLENLLNQWESPHDKLHISAGRIVKQMEQGDLDPAKDIYNKETLPALEELKGCYDRTMGWIDAQVQKQQGAVDIFNMETLPAVDSTRMLLKEITQSFEEQAKKSVFTMDSTMSRNRMLILVLTAAAVILGTFVATLIIRMIAGALSKSAQFADNMARGDFTQTLDIDQKDEIGILAGSMNNMTSNLGKMFREIRKDVEILDASSTELSAISRRMNDGSIKTSQRASSVATASEEMSSNMTSVSAATEQTATNVGMVASATEEMASTVNEIAQNSGRARGITDKAVLQAQQASKDVEELGDSAKEISKVVETINDISEQVNLLALNATIEAARAGEAGKGFAVVANEIKDLARQTAAAAQEIKGKITHTQESTGKIVHKIKDISQVIGDINDIVATIATAVEEQAATTREVSENVSQASHGIREVTENVAQSSSVAGEIARDIAVVNEEAKEISSSSKKVNMSAEDLSMLAEKLKKLVGRFKLS
jgi:methyl-accepting chemotaxis protein